MPTAAWPCLQLPKSGQACSEQRVSPYSFWAAMFGDLIESWTLPHAHVRVHRAHWGLWQWLISCQTQRSAQQQSIQRLCGVLCRVLAAALSASEPAACTQSRVAQHAQHSSAPDMSCSPQNGKMSSMQLPPTSPDLPSTAAEGNTPAQCQSFPSWLVQQV